jgi:hypothetical protein
MHGLDRTYTVELCCVPAASAQLKSVVNAYGTAAATALDRYGGASETRDLTWAAQQASMTITVGDVLSDQQSISTTGFTTHEKSNAKLVGLTEPRQSRSAARRPKQ